MNTFWWCLNTGLLCYGAGLRVSAYYYRKAARQAAAALKAQAE